MQKSILTRIDLDKYWDVITVIRDQSHDDGDEWTNDSTDEQCKMIWNQCKPEVKADLMKWQNEKYDGVSTKIIVKETEAGRYGQVWDNAVEAHFDYNFHALTKGTCDFMRQALLPWRVRKEMVGLLD